MSDTLHEAIARQRQILKGWLSSSLSILADSCREVWPYRAGLEARLVEGMKELPYCKYLYVLDANAHQITANLSRKGLM